MKERRRRHGIARAAQALALTFAALSGAGCDPVPDRPAQPNLLLVSVDTLRADHLGAYGYEPATSPRLDALARRSLLFREMLAPTPWTLPSHAGMLTGIHPYHLGIENRRSALPTGVPTVAEHLAAAGYATAALVDSMPRGLLGGHRGFDRGFASYRHLPHESEGFRYDMAVTVDAAAEWLRSRDPARPFFLFLHTKSVHGLPSDGPSEDPRAFPYEKPQAYRARFVTAEGDALVWKDPDLGDGIEYLRGFNEAVARGERTPAEFERARLDALRGLYDAGIYYVDEHLGRLLDELASLGIADDTAVLITSDHGESFLEHELLLHKEVNRQVLRVPLILHRPWEPEAREVSDTYDLMSVAPTLLALAGLPAPPELRAPALPLGPGRADGRESEPPRPAFAYYHFLPDYYYEAYSVRDRDHTLIRRRLGRGNPDYETRLYRSPRSDPQERQPVTDEPELERALTARLEAWRRARPVRRGRTIELDAETARHLDALGYVE